MPHLHTCPIHRSPRFHAAVLLKFRPGHLMSLCFQREGLALSEVVKVSLIDSLSLLLLLFAAGLSVAAQVPCCSVCVLWLRESVFQRPSGTPSICLQGGKPCRGLWELGLGPGLGALLRCVLGKQGQAWVSRGLFLVCFGGLESGVSPLLFSPFALLLSLRQWR